MGGQFTAKRILQRMAIQTVAGPYAIPALIARETGVLDTAGGELNKMGLLPDFAAKGMNTMFGTSIRTSSTVNRARLAKPSETDLARMEQGSTITFGGRKTKRNPYQRGGFGTGAGLRIPGGGQ